MKFREVFRGYRKEFATDDENTIYTHRDDPQIGDAMRILREIEMETLGGDIPKAASLEVVTRSTPTQLRMDPTSDLDSKIRNYPGQYALIDGVLLTTPYLATFKNPRQGGPWYEYSTHDMVLALSIGAAEDSNGTPIEPYRWYRIGGQDKAGLGSSIAERIQQGAGAIQLTGSVQIEDLGSIEQVTNSFKSAVEPVLFSWAVKDLPQEQQSSQPISIVDFATMLAAQYTTQEQQRRSRNTKKKRRSTSHKRPYSHFGKKR